MTNKIEICGSICNFDIFRINVTLNHTIKYQNDSLHKTEIFDIIDKLFEVEY
jgi:hypothetical protein